MRAAAHPQGKEVVKLAGIHGQHDFGLAGVRENKAGVLLVRVAQIIAPTAVPLVHLLHLSLVLSHLIFAEGFNGWWDHITKSIPIADVTLAADAEAGNAMPGELCQQHAANTAYDECKGAVLHYTVVV